jgi:hypothetical protein
MFYLATLYCGLRYWEASDTRADRNLWLILATLACLAGAASKEVIVSAPVVLLLFEWTFLGGSLLTILLRSWPLYLGLSSSWLLLLALHWNTPHSDTAGFAAGVAAHIWWLTQTKALWMYLKLAFWPWPLVIHYELPYVTSLADAWMYLVPTVMMAVAAFVLLWRRSAVGFVIGIVFAILSPTLIVPITTEVAAERRMYLPLAAIVPLVVVSGFILLERLGFKRRLAIAAAIVAVIILASGTVSSVRLKDFENPVLLWRGTLAHQADSPLAHHNLAVALWEAGQPAEAIEHYESAVQLKPDFLEARCNLGLALFNLGRPADAIEHFQAAVRLRPNAFRIRNNLGVALFAVGRTPEAIVEFERTLKLRPDFVEAQENLARARRQGVTPSNQQ